MNVTTSILGLSLQTAVLPRAANQRGTNNQLSISTMALDKQMAFRIDGPGKNAFEATCKEANRIPGEILRELVEAFNDNRLRIKPKKVNNPNQLEMYKK